MSSARKRNVDSNNKNSVEQVERERLSSSSPGESVVGQPRVSLLPSNVSEKEEKTNVQKTNEKLKTGSNNWSSWNQLSLCAHADSPLAVLRPLMIATEISCHGLVWIIASITTLMCTHKIRHAQVIFNLLFGLIADLIIVGFLKCVVRRPRPTSNRMDMVATVPMDEFSFPSGHSTRTTFLTLFFADQVFKSSFKPVLAIALWSVLVCISRLLLGRHHLSDVVMGCVIGTLEYYGLAYIWFSEHTTVRILEPIFGQFL